MFNRVSILTIFPLGSVAYAIGDKERMCLVILGHWDGGTVAMETCRSPTTPFRPNHSRAAKLWVPCHRGCHALLRLSALWRVRCRRQSSVPFWRGRGTILARPLRAFHMAAQVTGRTATSAATLGDVCQWQNGIKCSVYWSAICFVTADYMEILHHYYLRDKVKNITGSLITMYIAVLNSPTVH